MSELWCVHVQGPDTIIAQPSREAADQRVAEWNQMFEQIKTANGRKPTEFDPVLHAVVIPWDGSAEFHAEELAKHGGNPDDIC